MNAGNTVREIDPQLEVRDGVREPVRLLLAISMPQDGSMMPISLVPLKGVVRALGTSDL
jgi:hypothetical protein